MTSRLRGDDARKRFSKASRGFGFSMYVCPHCHKEFKKEELTFIRCPYCGSKVLFKKTPPTVKAVSTN